MDTIAPQQQCKEQWCRSVSVVQQVMVKEHHTLETYTWVVMDKVTPKKHYVHCFMMACKISLQGHQGSQIRVIFQIIIYEGQHLENME